MTEKVPPQGVTEDATESVTETIGCIKAIVANRHAGNQQKDSTILEFMRMLLRLDAHTSFPSVTSVPLRTTT